MSIDIPPGFSVQLSFDITDGAAPPVPDTETLLTNLTTSNPAVFAVVYPDTTPGVVNPKRSVRLDVPASAANLSSADFNARYTSPYDGTIRNFTQHINAVKPPNAGAATTAVGAPFRTPA